MGNGIDFADVAKELIAEPLSLGGAPYKAGDIHKFKLRRDHIRRAGQHRKLVEPRVRHGNAAWIRLDGAEGIIRRLGRGGFRQGVKERRFADIRLAD